MVVNIKTKDIVIPLGVDFFDPQALPVKGFAPFSTKGAMEAMNVRFWQNTTSNLNQWARS